LSVGRIYPTSAALFTSVTVASASGTPRASVTLPLTVERACAEAGLQAASRPQNAVNSQQMETVFFISSFMGSLFVQRATGLQ
jgi:hypothetical protein